jgi:hypothetical protein
MEDNAKQRRFIYLTDTMATRYTLLQTPESGPESKEKLLVVIFSSQLYRWLWYFQAGWNIFRRLEARRTLPWKV